MNRLHVACLAIVMAVIPVHPAFGSGGAHGPHPDRGRDPGHQESRQAKVKIKVTSKGFEPSIIRMHAGDRLTLLVTRKTDETCAKEILIPSLGTKEQLALDKTVRIYLGPQQAGRIAFACGMNMFKGEIVVQE